MPKAACSKKWRRVTARRRDGSFVIVHHSLVTASSRFSRTLATIVQAASSGRFAALVAAARPLASTSRVDSLRVAARFTERVSTQLPPRSAAARAGSTAATPCRGGVARPSGARGQRARGLERRRIVEQRQRLQRRVGADAAHRAELAAGGVERHEARIRRRAAPERVEAAAVPILALLVGPLVAL